MTARALVLALVLLVVGATPASAHGGSTTQATRYRTQLDGLAPDVDGVAVRLVDRDTRIELDAGEHDVVVLGYEGEPYLRVDGDGVFENRRSPSVYLNTSLTGAPPPPEADADAAPDWRRIGDGPVVRWHDHALHVPPGQRAGDRDVTRWERPLLVDGDAVSLRGRIVTLRARSSAPWLAIAAVLAVVAVVASRRAWRVTVVASLAVLVVADGVRIAGLVAGTPTWLQSRWHVISDASTLSIIGWGMAVAALALLRLHRRLEAAAAAIVAAGVLALTGGVLEVGDLTTARLGSALPDAMARALVAIVLGVGVGLLVGAALELRRVSPIRVRPAPRSDTAPNPGDGTRTGSRSAPPSD
jgi:hypothetical protein